MQTCVYRVCVCVWIRKKTWKVHGLLRKNQGNTIIIDWWMPQYQKADDNIWLIGWILCYTISFVSFQLNVSIITSLSFVLIIRKNVVLLYTYINMRRWSLSVGTFSITLMQGRLLSSLLGDALKADWFYSHKSGLCAYGASNRQHR